jgi:cytochrome P450
MSATQASTDLSDPASIVSVLLRGEPLALEDPYELYNSLREIAPRYDGEEGMLVLTAYADVMAALRHPAMSSSADLRSDPRYPGSAVLQFFGSSMLFTDDADAHGRLRSLVRQAFTRQTVQALRSSTEALTGELIDRCLERGSFDFMDDFVEQIPVAVICKMLGVPNEDIEKFAKWNFLITTATGPSVGDEQMARVDEAAISLRAYLLDLLEQRKRQPGEDLLSKLIEARDGENQLTDEETLCMAGFLLAAGSDTTSAFLGTATLALLRNPDQLRQLKDDRSLMPGAIEELLRYDGPVHFGIIRTATEACSVNEVEVAEGTRVWTILSAANRDPAAFPDPDRLDVSREKVRHLGFAQGMHMCLGAMLARLESEIVLEAVLDRFAELELRQDPIPWVNHGNLRGLAQLEVAGTAA